VAAIFDSVDHAREAAKSLVGSILAEDGVIINDIVDIIPQKVTIPFADMRGTRVDIFVETDKKERILVEVQMYKEPLLERNLLAISQDVVNAIEKGTNVWRLHSDFPVIYVINIMNYTDRSDSDDYFQPIKLMYTKPPMREAFNKLKIYNIQLPAFRKKEHDLSKSLDAWLYILDTANEQNKSVKEVIGMNEALQKKLTVDPGIKQFMQNYEHAVADDKVRKEYNSYIQGLFYVNGILHSAFEDGNEEGMKIGLQKGMQQGLQQGLQQGKLEGAEQANLTTARNMLLGKIPPADIQKFTGLPLETILSIKP
jgi:predicted transposase/invertase (TIGR01784 family)